MTVKAPVTPELVIAVDGVLVVAGLIEIMYNNNSTSSNLGVTIADSEAFSVVIIVVAIIYVLPKLR